jgi:UDP:flavonoid glycosyltransferase YjiC (YdhE family)
MPWAMPVEDSERPLLKRLAFTAVGWAIGLITTRPLQRMRQRQGLPPVGPEGFTSARLNLVPVSPAVYAPNPGWDPRHWVVGYWYAEEPSSWEPPKELHAFLKEAEPPLAVSLGAMSLGRDDGRESASLFADAIQRAGVRAIVQDWQEDLEQSPLPRTIYAAGSLPRTSGVVHHGGFGTTGAVLRAGIPHLVIPHVADHFFWGNRVHELGVGLAPMRRTRLDTAGLAAALKELAHSRELRTAASLLGEQIRAENGVDHAVQLIVETFDPPFGSAPHG